MIHDSAFEIGCAYRRGCRCPACTIRELANPTPAAPAPRDADLPTARRWHVPEAHAQRVAVEQAIACGHSNRHIMSTLGVTYGYAEAVRHYLDRMNRTIDSTKRGRKRRAVAA